MGDAQRAPLATVRDLIVLGQPLPFHVHDAQGRRLLAAGQTVAGETQLNSLLERGAWVDADEAAGARQKRQAPASGGDPLLSTYREPTLFDRWEKMVWELDGVLRRVLAGQNQAQAIATLGQQVVDQVERDVDVALFVTVRHNEPRYALYALTHALHTATVLVVLARQLGWPDEQLHCLVRGALTMNVSILELQAHMAMQPDPPTARQKQTIRSHPEASSALLQAAGVIDEVWLGMVRAHHERPDGTGYPLGVTDSADLAHALRVADVFTAKISPRAIRPALPIQLAARQLFQEERGGPLATGMIKALGLYPPGDLVQLKNGEIAVVVRRGQTATTPLVASLTNTQGLPVATTTHRDTSRLEFAITGAAVAHKGLSRVLPERVYGLMN